MTIFYSISCKQWSWLDVAESTTNILPCFPSSLLVLFIAFFLPLQHFFRCHFDVLFGDGFSSLSHFDVDMDVVLMCTMDMEQNPMVTTLSLLNINSSLCLLGSSYANDRMKFYFFFIFIKFLNFNKIKF